MDNLKKSQNIIIGFVVIIILIIAVFAWFIINDVINKKDNVVINTNNLLIDLNPNINNKLDVIKDNKINKLKKYNIKITNNGSNTKYKIVLNNVIENDDNIKIAVNNDLIRNISKLKKEDNSYILYEGEISSGYTAIYNIRIWLTDETNNNDYNFKLNVIEQ